MRKNVTMGFVVGLLILVPIFCSASYGDPGEALIIAAKRGDLKLVQDLLEKGVGVDSKDDSGLSALMAAAITVSPTS
jgi:hypothetical protein